METLGRSINRPREWWEMKGFRTDPELSALLLDRHLMCLFHYETKLAPTALDGIEAKLTHQEGRRYNDSENYSRDCPEILLRHSCSPQNTFSQLQVSFNVSSNSHHQVKQKMFYFEKEHSFLSLLINLGSLESKKLFQTRYQRHRTYTD